MAAKSPSISPRTDIEVRYCNRSPSLHSAKIPPIKLTQQRSCSSSRRRGKDGQRRIQGVPLPAGPQLPAVHHQHRPAGDPGIWRHVPSRAGRHARPRQRGGHGQGHDGRLQRAPRRGRVQLGRRLVVLGGEDAAQAVPADAARQPRGPVRHGAGGAAGLRGGRVAGPRRRRQPAHLLALLQGQDGLRHGQGGHVGADQGLGHGLGQGGQGRHGHNEHLACCGLFSP